MVSQSVGAAALGAAIPRQAQARVDGRVLVCLHLFGGNDSNNLLVPLDASQYRNYAGARGELTIPVSALLPVEAPASRTLYGFHPQLAGLQAMYKEGSLAVVSNMGCCSRLARKGEYVTGGTTPPRGYLQHNEGKLQYVKGGFCTPSWAAGTLGLSPGFLDQQLLTFSDGVTLASAVNFNISGLRTDNAMVKSILAAQPPLAATFAGTSLGRGLEHVARLIQAGPSLSLGRQIIFLGTAGYDTHSGQMDRQAALFFDLSQSLPAFRQALVAMGAWNRVTLFTQTDFNRTLRANERHGSEHGWGGHELVLGGSVAGGEVHGRFPSLALSGDDDIDGYGRWIPATAFEQYAATLANWLGAPPSNLVAALPNLRSFQPLTLGFLR
ncbi:MAG: DUF1501 domain-containing protein [Bryobacterales bacterium]|nr:DUF1501 domain-containing protein [Bryobacterales bacterium]